MPWLKRDSLSLFYEDSPGPSPPLVLVHGLGCDRSFMAPQAEAFAGSHRVVTVDLSGHGRSDKPDQDYSIRAYAEELAWILRQLDLERAVVVGHSMGGGIGLELAARHGEQLAGLVVLDAAVLPPPAVADHVRPVIDVVMAPGFDQAARQFFAEALFLPSDDTERKAAILETMLATPRHVLAPAMANIFAWDSATAAARCRVPTLYIGASHPRGDMAHFAKLCPSLVCGQVVGSGHFLQLEVPDQVNAMIRRFLEVYVPRPADGAGPAS